MTKEQQLKLGLLLSAIWMLVIFCFSHQAHSGRITEDYLGDANVPVRKFAHMFEYAVLAILYYRTLLLRAGLNAQKHSNHSAANLALLMAIVYALSDEWHQSFVPGRSATFSDVLVDASGALIGLLLIWLGSRGRSAR